MVRQRSATSVCVATWWRWCLSALPYVLQLYGRMRWRSELSRRVSSIADGAAVVFPSSSSVVECSRSRCWCRDDVDSEFPST
jgi:hypothetical protein